MSESENRSTPDGRDDSGDEAEADPHGADIEGLPDGSGCVEIWEHLSERRRRD